MAVRVVNGENLITIPARDAAYCNYVPCSWKGTISEAKKRKAEDSNPNAVKRPTG